MVNNVILYQLKFKLKPTFVPTYKNNHNHVNSFQHKYEDGQIYLLNMVLSTGKIQPNNNKTREQKYKSFWYVFVFIYFLKEQFCDPELKASPRHDCSHSKEAWRACIFIHLCIVLFHKSIYSLKRGEIKQNDNFVYTHRLF